MRRTLQILLALFGATVIFISLLHIVLGPAAIPGSVVGGLARIVSMLAVGLPNSFFIAMTVLELALPAVYSFLMFRVAAQEDRGTRNAVRL